MTTTCNVYRVDKLVRNGSLDNMQQHGTHVNWVAPDSDTVASILLHHKLDEELAELRSATTPDAFKEELADVLEVLMEIAKRKGIPFEVLQAARELKTSRRGDFSGGYFVTTIECPQGSFWDTYCAKEPGKYPPNGTVEHPL